MKVAKVCGRRGDEELRRISLEGTTMYFVIIDLQQLNTRLINSGTSYSSDVFGWLKAQHFIQSEEGWLATADSMNSLSCSEIIFSERRLFDLPPRSIDYGQFAS